MFRQCVLLLLMFAAGSAARADNFGAIAFNEGSGAFGYSYNWRSRQQAAADAMRRCPGHCEVISEFWNNCGSLAANKQGAYGWAANIDENVATRQAVANCAKRAAGCQIKVTVCNDVLRSSPSPSGTKDRYIGRHGCWYADWSRIPGCKD